MQIDILIKNGIVFNAYLKSFVPSDIAIVQDRIYYVGTEETHLLKSDNTIDAKGKWIVPGLIDIHMHIESSVSTPYTFSKELMKRGVTTIVSEPHEIANVHGIEGVEAMIEASKECDIDILFGVPSCVPSTSEVLETTGGSFDVDEIKHLFTLDKVACLGEFMNFGDLISSEDSKSHRILKYVKEKYPQFPIEGHCPHQLKGLDLAKFIYYGADSDHTIQKIDSMVERIANGMFIQIQEKSMKPEIFDVIKEKNLYEHVALVTDDVMPTKLMNYGHLDHLIKKSVSMGLSMENALYMSTYTPSKRMRLYDRGAIAPGKLADIVILNDLQSFDVALTLKSGRIIYDKLNDNSEKEVNNYKFPDAFYKSVKLSPLEAHQLELRSEDIIDGELTCRVMEVRDGTTYTDVVERDFKVIDNKICWENTDCLLVVVFERYGKQNNFTLGLITGDTIKRGALASTYVHDHHNLLVIGKNIDDMLLAANDVIESQGGICVVENNSIKAKIDLPIGGILSDQPMEIISNGTQEIETALTGQGYSHYSPIMSMATNGLVVSPALKITDKGLVNVLESTIVSLII